MSQSTLESNTLETFDRANPDLIDHNLDDLDNDFEYLFPTPPLLVHSVGWEKTNDLSAIIDRGQYQEDLPSDNIFIPNNPLAKIAMQDIVNINSARATQTLFNILFDTKNIANFYIISSSSLLAHYYSEERKDSTIKDDTNQPPDNLALRQKWEIIRHVGSKKPYWTLDNIATTICQMIKEKIDIMPKPWQVNAMINIVYKKKDVVISAGIRFGKSQLY